MSHNNSLASLLDFPDRHCPTCVQHHHHEHHQHHPHHHHHPDDGALPRWAPSPQTTLHSMPPELRTIVKHTSQDFAGGFFVPEREDGGKPARSVVQFAGWLLSHGRMTLLLVLVRCGFGGR